MLSQFPTQSFHTVTAIWNSLMIDWILSLFALKPSLALHSLLKKKKWKLFRLKLKTLKLYDLMSDFLTNFSSHFFLYKTCIYSNETPNPLPFPASLTSSVPFLLSGITLPLGSPPLISNPLVNKQMKHFSVHERACVTFSWCVWFPSHFRFLLSQYHMVLQIIWQLLISYTSYHFIGQGSLRVLFLKFTHTGWTSISKYLLK